MFFRIACSLVLLGSLVGCGSPTPEASDEQEIIIDTEEEMQMEAEANKNN